MLERGPKLKTELILSELNPILYQYNMYLKENGKLYTPYNTCCNFLTLRPRISLHIASYHQQHEQQHSNTQRQDTF